jgi:hypothetical protein
VREDKAILLEGGAEREFPLDAFREILLEGTPQGSGGAAFELWMRQGDHVRAQTIREGQSADALDLSGSHWEAHGVPLSSLEALASASLMSDGSPEALDELRAARADPPVGSDRLMLERGGRRFSVTCTVQRLTESGVSIVASGASTTVPWAEVAWVVMGRVGTGAQAVPEGHQVCLADGSAIRLQSLSVESHTLAGRMGPALYSVDARAVRLILIASEAYRYLSDLKPQRVEVRPFLDVAWQPRFDSASTGGPLSLEGKAYAKGIGMHTRTEMAFDVAGRYSQFFATVGVDAAAGSRGAVIFRILADGRNAFESPSLKGGDAAQPVAVDIRGAQTLTLVADFGSPLEASGNFADWAEARVVR